MRERPPSPALDFPLAPNAYPLVPVSLRLAHANLLHSQARIAQAKADKLKRLK